MNNYDVIVIGGGHAGCEAAAAAARMGSKTLLVTMNLQTIGQMSCNPAMGGVAKGQIVREIDALGGFSGKIADKTAIQFRMLNRSKGAAMWSPRVQSDRMQFATMWRETLESIESLDFIQGTAVSLLVEKNAISGVTLSNGQNMHASSVILTSGTFLNGVIHVGENQYSGGRSGEIAATGITASLIELGFAVGRMKTGTPPRIDGRSLDYTKFTEQPGDEDPRTFAFHGTKRLTKQRSCWLSATNENAHDIMREAFDRSPLFNGAIQSSGPRYCPSVEDKINRFTDKTSHQMFIEPEGWSTVEMYINGFSTSLPEEIQHRALRSIPGFERAKFFRPGYAVEYDYFPPTQLSHSLETHLVNGLFFAGQINGTTGYEEAACQGLMAGINAHARSKNIAPTILDRSQAYIGVLIDDLITKGTDEPYRMFTSRAEFRLSLRQDNADQRLTAIGRSLGLIDDDQWSAFELKMSRIETASTWLKSQKVTTNSVNKMLVSKGSSPIKQQMPAVDLATRPQLSLMDVIACLDPVDKEDFNQEEVWEDIATNLKYAGYIAKEQDQVDKLKRMESMKIPKLFAYKEITALSHEARQKLSNHQPATIGHASRISGVSPADIQVLLVHLGR
jgi:tRNA uridine 5-carboxymethylaminomethyl modification enzyme